MCRSPTQTTLTIITDPQTNFSGCIIALCQGKRKEIRGESKNGEERKKEKHGKGETLTVL